MTSTTIRILSATLLVCAASHLSAIDESGIVTSAVPETTAATQQVGQVTADETAAPATPAPLAEPAKPAKPSFNLRQTLQSLDNQFLSIEYKFRKIEEAKKGDTTARPEMYLAEIESACEKLKTLLESAKKDATEAGITSLAEFDAVKAKLDTIPGRLAQVRKSVAEAQAAHKAAAETQAADKAAEAAKALTNDLQKSEEKTDEQK